LQSEVERRLGVELEDDAMAGAVTLGDLRRLIVEEQGAEEPSPEISPQNIAGPVKTREAVEFTYPHWPWSWPVRAIRAAFLECAMRPLVWLLAAPRVVRAKELPQGPMLVIANHVTAYDGALVLYALPGRLRRRMAIAMAGEMLLDLRRGRNQESGLLNALAPAGYWLVTALFNVFPLPRLRGFRRSFEHAGEAMDRGDSVMIFPEGTRSADGRMQRFRAGIGLLAQASRVPVVPVALMGLGGKRWFRTGGLELRVGEAIAFEDGMDAEALTARFEESVRLLQG
jgi:long-chain acyl-CoA synthetase